MRNQPRKGSDWSTKSVTGYTTVKWRRRLPLSWNSTIPCHQYNHPSFLYSIYVTCISACCHV